MANCLVNDGKQSSLGGDTADSVCRVLASGAPVRRASGRLPRSSRQRDLSQALIKEFVITVSGRPSARLVPAQLTRWQRWADVADLFGGPDDPEWSRVRELLDDALRDPWAVR